MKVIGVLSSPHGSKSVTLPLVKAALAGAESEGAATGAIDVCKLKLKYCKGCHTCYREGACPQKDDLQETLDQLLEADGLVLSSPNYIGNVTAQMKTLMDRMTDAVHSKLFYGKYGFSVATAGGAGEEQTIRILNDWLLRCGAIPIGGAGFAVSWGPKKEKETLERSRLLGQELACAIREKRHYPEQEKALEEGMKNFAFAVKMNKDMWPHDYERWVDMGWLKP